MLNRISLKSRLLLLLLAVNSIVITAFMLIVAPSPGENASSGFDALDFILAGLIFIAVSFILNFLVLSILLRKLGELREYSKVLISTNFTGNYEILKQIKKISSKNHGETSDLANIIYYMNSMIEQYYQNLNETYLAKEKIETELSVAAGIQMGILPMKFPAFPERKDFVLHAIIQPAKDVGGDLYDYFLIDDNRLFFIIGDVSDKGVPAALFMIVTKTLFNTYALHTDFRDIADIVKKVNAQLSQDNPKLMFVTVFAGILDLRTGLLEYVDGGHESPYLIKNGNDFLMLEKQGGKLPLGVMGDFEYQTNTLKMEAGDILLLYTDGVTDAINPDNDRFGEKGIASTLNNLRHNPNPEEINNILKRNILTYSLGAPQFDDMALLTIQYRGGRLE